MLHPLVITLAGLSALCVLMLPYILPGLELWGVMYDFHLSSSTFFLCHFRTQLLISMSNFLLGSSSNRLNELLSIWVRIFCSQSLLSKMKKREPLSWARTVWLFHDLISFNALFLLSICLAEHFSLLLCQIYLFLCSQ